MKAVSYVQPEESMGEAVYRYLQEHLTEERTDTWIAAIAALPIPGWIPKFIPRFVVGRVLDWLFPEKLLALLGFFFRKLGLIPPKPTERQLHPDNPFRPTPPTT